MSNVVKEIKQSRTRLGVEEATVQWGWGDQVRTGPEDQVTVKWALSPARIRQAGHRK